MGVKRSFDDEEFQEVPFKHSKQLDYCNKLTQFAESVPFNNVSKKPDISGEIEVGFHKFQWNKAFENDTSTEVPNLADKDYETSAPLSWLTSSSSEEDSGSGATAFSSLSTEYFEFDFPRRTFVPFEDVYSSLLDQSPRKQVPLGPNHQATIPSWGGHIKKKLDTSMIDDDHEERLMGSCIVPMPGSNFSAHNSDEVGDGIMGCSCLDGGSVTCVQQHVMEAREKLRKTLGPEKFVNLGFCDMGEEVACKWSEEEERVFRDVVYSNPSSLGRNFWKHLSVAFPSRTKMELVSYYFNVFMLRRRAAQNRSRFLDIDSDDDEWHGSNGDSYEVRVSKEEELSAIESLDDQVNTGEDSLEEDDDEDDDDHDDDSDSDGGVGDACGDNISEDCQLDHKSEGHVVKSSDEGRLDPTVQHVDKVSGSVGGNFNVQDDSCISFEFQSNDCNMAHSCGPVDAGAALQVSGMKTNLSKCLRSKVNDLTGHAYLSESYDAKFWESRYPIGSIKGMDLLPTCNIIEEIFGQETWDNKTRNE